MLLKSDCFVCLYTQSLRATKVLGCEEECKKKVVKKTAALLSSLNEKQTPPEAASLLYPLISNITGVQDLYEKEKERSIKKAQEVLKVVKEELEGALDKLDLAIRLSVAGNVIDFATEVTFSLEEEVKKIFNVKFAIDQKPQLIQQLAKSDEIVVLGDNVGEHLFDKLMIETFKEQFPHLKVYYFVRGKPVINDVTLKEALEAKMNEVCEVVDSGVDTPGFVYSRATKYAKELFDKAPLIISKGMGNFECLESRKDERIFYLFKVKCSVVAQRVGLDVGSLICGKNL
ncbi:MAG: DUF89 family protein [Epsilonproteobacteria bacterium]|nr:DUF89 family protein [Campylobacterota bacterium]